MQPQRPPLRSWSSRIFTATICRRERCIHAHIEGEGGRRVDTRACAWQIIITRGNNVYGAKQFPEKVIPKFIRRLLNGKACCIHGSGAHRRHYIHVADVTAALLVIMHDGVVGETYNIGCEDEMTNLELAKKIVQAVLPGAAWEDHIEYVRDR